MDMRLNFDEESSFTIKEKICFTNGKNGRKQIAANGKNEEPPIPKEIGRIPRLTRLLALALKFEDLIKANKCKDYAEIAKLGHLSRARVTQIMNLTLLSARIIENILFMPRILKGRDLISEHELREIVSEADWDKQWMLWTDLTHRFKKEKAE
ncbi:MAG: hypothetical protein HQK78_03120 [Desulfobacterales bacterium]|nr:hypothetical protein [Desulfobacterales bacterium]